jgi:hypothetical protein
MNLHATKYPARRFAVTIDWTPWLGSDTISGTPSVAADNVSGITIENLSTASGVTSFLLGGGTAGSVGLVTATATSTGGKIEPVYLSVRVIEAPTAIGAT